MTTRPATRRLPIVLGLAILASLLWSGLAVGPAAAVTGSTLEAQIVGLVNQHRTARGLRPLRGDLRVADLAGDRAAVLARRGILSHTAPGDIGSQLRSRRIQWYRYGEVIAYASGWGSATATRIFNLWKNSASHWSLLMSNRFNYLGAGLAYRSTGLTFGSIVLTESVDHSRPRIQMTDWSRSGTTIRWAWTGWDLALQTHTAGVRDFDIQYRLDARPWSTIRNNTGLRSIRLINRTRGHSYWLRVRSTDRRGIVSAWSAAIRIYVN
jgi:cysteine-rich secretory family protein